MISQARLNANRRNGQLSTGPRTDLGKARARQNALRHGLAGSGIVLPDAETAKAAKRVIDWRPCFKPPDVFHEWLLEQAVLQSVRLETCNGLDIAMRGIAVERAHALWDEDRSLDAERLAVRLSKQPALVVAELQRSKHGCDWLIARWDALHQALVTNGAWTDAQREFAFDLLGV